MINKKSKKPKYIIGLDEVGRGPLAGPVTVAAVALKVNSKFKIQNSKFKLRDSKRLSPQKREKWFDWIKENKIPYAVASVSPKIIDKINVSKAANLAVTRAFQKLTKNYEVKAKSCKVYLDGGLHLKTIYPIPHTLSPRTVIRGDEKIKAVMLASIVAKVTRDRKMRQLHKKYPYYGFAQHKGYGTKKHFRVIKKNGICVLHRKTFLKNLYKRKPR